MADRNYIHISGRLTSDVTLRYTSNGKGVSNFSIANNNYGDNTYFFDCVAWDKGNYKLAEYMAKGEKGNLIDLTGQLIVEEYEGNKKYKINVNDFINCTQYGNRSNNSSSKNTSNDEVEELDEDFDEKVPF